MPIIDSIDPDSFVYRGGGVKLLGFTWTLGIYNLFILHPAQLFYFYILVRLFVNTYNQVKITVLTTNVHMIL